MVAGEPSGDLLGASLIRSLKTKNLKNLAFKGVGGPLMTAEGLESLFPMEELSIVGLVEIIPHIPNVLRRIQQTADHIHQINPDIVVTLDAPGFNFRLAKKLKAFRVPLVHYTAPTVWAWRPGRARKIADLYQHLLTLFSFEPPFFEIHGLKSTFVGHPLIEKNIDQIAPQAFFSKYHLSPGKPMVCVLPGSRQGELNKLLPIFGKTLQALKQLLPDLEIVIPTLLHLEARMKKFVGDHNFAAIVVTDENEKYQAMQACTVALAASGTVTLELLLAETPMVVAYKVSKLTEWIMRPLMTTKFAALPNILAKEQIVQEYLQDDCSPETLQKALYQLITNWDLNQNQRSKLRSLKHMLGDGNHAPSELAAGVILEICHKTI